MSDFDQGARYAFKQLDPAEQILWVLPADTFPAWKWAGWLDAQRVPFPGEPERRCDCVVVLERPAGDHPPAAVVVEFMSRPSGVMPERMGEYVLGVRRELPYERDPLVPYAVVGVIVNLTGPEQSPSWQMAPPDLGGLGLSSLVGVRTLRTANALELLRSVERKERPRGLLVWVPLMDGDDQEEVARLWVKLAVGEPDEKRRADLGGLARVFASLAKREDVWDKALEGWNVERSPVVLEWEKRGREAERRDIIAMLRVTLVGQLQERFPGQSMPEIVAAINAQTDASILARWIAVAGAASNIDKVRSAIVPGA